MLVGSGQAGMKRPAEGWDRSRVRERLHAALAGLQELQVLRDKQQALVSGALAMQPAAPPPPPPPPQSEPQPPVPRPPWLPHLLPSVLPAGDSHSKEHRLEATLTALKEQLSRLRRQDVGLKTHLDQLDQQISELKLDVNKTSSENLDSDSRPSSGFYDLSDGGSCSLSNSCTSVYSESISSSHSSLLPGIQTPKVRLSIFDYRPKSADETTVHSAHLQPQRIPVSEGCWIKGSPESEGETLAKLKPRPVSTGDLERIVPADGGLQKTITDPKSVSPLCHGTEILFHVVDPKYQSDLVSKSGNDIYPYPSPLHAVALQSPLFSLTRETLETNNHLPLSKPSLNMSGPSLIRTKPIVEVPPPGGYIDKLLQLTRDRGKYTGGSVSERGSVKGSLPPSQQRLSITSGISGLRGNSDSQLEKQVSSPESRQAKVGRSQREVPDANSMKLQEAREACLDTEQPASQQSLESMATNTSFPEEVSPASTVQEEPGGIGLKQDTASCSQMYQSHLNMAPQRSNAKVILPPRKVGKKGTSLVTGEFVHAQFVPGEAHLMRLKGSNPKAKAMKAKRRNSDKVLRLGKQQPLLAERPRGMHVASRLPAEWNPSPRFHGGKNLVRRPTFVGEVTGRSCSESSLFPVQFLTPKVVSRPELYPASAHPLYSFEAAQLNLVASGGARKKQRKWQSTVEISAKTHLTSFSTDPSLALPRPPGRRAGILRTVSSRSRSKIPSHNTYAKSESDHSEYSAECASLFHSTIVETSEDDVSDYTANCFGDSESGDSDSDGACRSSESSLTLDYEEAVGSELIWPKAIVQQPVKGQAASKPSHHPVPKICRIKASKALKKKIRRFQPASLKVMTMV
ncbi:dapper homolog 2 [Monodelphis domestica]|uniref:dapper homolog 2 n=1 Tax=Monodelphis domestica TaxID=13616 RepID=UPI0024E1C1CC|nr:dapper homolog 2 [Monodelphis domestica]